MNLKERGGGVYKIVWREERAGRNVIKLQPQKLKKIHPENKIRIIKESKRKLPNCAFLAM